MSTLRLQNVKTRILPQFFPADWLESCPIVFTGFPSVIRIGYVLRSEESYSFLLTEEFDHLGISIPELHDIAITNLFALTSGRISSAKPPGGPEGWIAADDNFAAAHILLPTVRNILAEAIGEKFLVALPHRDDCLFWSLSQPQERQAMHAAEVMEGFMNDDYRLTPDILLATAEGFSLYQTQSVA